MMRAVKARALFTCMYNKSGDLTPWVTYPSAFRSRRERFIFEAVIYATNQETFSQLQAI